jgi:hypothetical protein
MQRAQDFNPLGARLDATTTKGVWLMMTDPDDLEVRAFLPGASMGMGGKVQRDRRIAAENPGDANFDVAYRCAFTINSSEYEQCMADIDKFSEEVAGCVACGLATRSAEMTSTFSRPGSFASARMRPTWSLFNSEISVGTKL